MNKFLQFMYGRRGLDLLSIVLIVFSFVLSIVFRFCNIGIFYLISYVPLVWAIFRMLSKNIIARQKENDIFIGCWNKTKMFFGKKSQNFKNHQNYKYFKCPNCQQKLRAPRGKGKIQVRCQTCGKTFIKKV